MEGVEVSLIARGAHLAAIRENGLKLLIGEEERVAKVTATDNPAELGPQDYVIVALKTHQAWEVADQMVPLLGPRHRCGDLPERCALVVFPRREQRISELAAELC